VADRSETAAVRIKSEAIAWRVVDGEAVAFDVSRSEYVGLNAAATVILSQLDSGSTEAELSHGLASEFDVDLTTAERDVRTFLAACRERGWLDE